VEFDGDIDKASQKLMGEEPKKKNKAQKTKRRIQNTKLSIQKARNKIQKLKKKLQGGKPKPPRPAPNIVKPNRKALCKPALAAAKTVCSKKSKVVGKWVAKVDSKFSVVCTPTHALTRYRDTCETWCRAQKLECVRGQDNRGGCKLDPRHSRKDTSNNGCNQKWNDQVCQCGASVTIR